MATHRTICAFCEHINIAGLELRVLMIHLIFFFLNRNYLMRKSEKRSAWQLVKSKLKPYSLRFSTSCTLEHSQKIRFFSNSLVLMLFLFIHHAITLHPYFDLLKHKCDDLKRLCRLLISKENNNISPCYLGFLLLEVQHSCKKHVFWSQTICA